MTKILALDQDFLSITTDYQCFIDEIVHIYLDNNLTDKTDKKIFGRVIYTSLEKTIIHIFDSINQPLSSIKLHWTNSKLTINLSPTILGRSLDAFGNPIDLLDPIPAIKQGFFENKPNHNSTQNKIKQQSSKTDLRRYISSLTQDNLGLIVVGNHNSTRNRLLDTSFLSDISVNFECDNDSYQWIVAMELAWVVAEFVAVEFDFEVKIIVDGYSKYITTIDRLNNRISQLPEFGNSLSCVIPYTYQDISHQKSNPKVEIIAF